jgi:hypothetical protein
MNLSMVMSQWILGVTQNPKRASTLDRVSVVGLYLPLSCDL